MRTTILSAVFALAAGMLFASESNFYNNPGFKSRKDKKGNFTIVEHWYEGKASIDGKYEGSPVLRLEQVEVDWGGYNGAVVAWHDTKRDLKPGKYTFSILCKPQGITTSISLMFNLLPAGQEKRIRRTKAYKGADLPPVGKWTELVMNFEVKPGDTKHSFGFAAFSAKNVGPKVVFFANPRITPERED